MKLAASFSLTLNFYLNDRMQFVVFVGVPHPMSYLLTTVCPGSVLQPVTFSAAAGDQFYKLR